MNNMNVIIADDHPIVLFGIRKSLEQIEWVNVVGEFEDSTALINNLPKLDAHVLITDLSMPGDKYGDGITLIKYIKRHFPSISIIVLTMNNNPAILSAVLELDIEGIVLKQGARKASLVCSRKLAPADTVTNVCRRKRVKCCACSPKVSW
ncbi:Transcriptional regulatory protein RcsB [compost metagenome]